ncbi:Rabphilin-3A [Halotydeus destructor]|nr:Rabphilin-3A [Halotydeus destructor]
MSGWSVRTASSSVPSTNSNYMSSHLTSGSPNGSSVTTSTISEHEQEAIRNVIRRAQLSELMERERVERLIDRVNNMKRNASGDGKTCCALCNEKFHMFSTQRCHRCKDCEKAVCSKCGVDTITMDSETVWLCKICSETREMWKKSGAWFLGSLPTYTLTSHSRPSSRNRSPSLTSSSLTSLNSAGDSTQGASGGSGGSGGHQRPVSPVSLVDPAQYVQNSSKIHNSTRILSPVIRKKSRSPSPRNHRHAAFQFTANDQGALHAGNGAEDRKSAQFARD